MAVRRTRRSCSAGGCGPRRASRCSGRRSTPAARRITSASAGARQLRHRLGAKSVAEIYQGGHRAVPTRSSRRTSDEDPIADCSTGGCRAQGAAAAQRHDLALEPRPATASPTASRTSGSRTACCPQGRARRRDRQCRHVARIDESRRARHPEVNRMMPFETARVNFVSAARQAWRRTRCGSTGAEHSATSSSSTSCSPWPTTASRRAGSKTPTALTFSTSSSAGFGPATRGRVILGSLGASCATRAPPGSDSTV